MHTNSADTDLRVREHFNGQMELYIDRHRAKHLSICAERIELLDHAAVFPRARGAVRLLDIGCGAGYLSDAFLERYPAGRAIGVDVSTGMLARNRPDARKVLLTADARAIPFSRGEFDVINFDTVLHHIIHHEGYSSTIAGITALLTSLQHQLTPDGVIMIREIYHEFWLWRSLGCRLVHRLTCTQLPKPLASLLRVAGIKTANVGVCFLTRKQWHRVFQEAGFTILSETDHRWPSPLRFLGFSSGEVYYYLKPGKSN